MPRLLSHKPYRLRMKGASLNITVPKTVLLFTDIREDAELWPYATARGLLLSPEKLEKPYAARKK